jgi:hypothetical protein
LSTILNNIVEPESGVTILFNIVDNCEQCGQASINCSILFSSILHQPERFYACTRVKIEKINNLLQVDIDRREQGCAAHYEQYCQHVVTALFNCNNLEQHG